MMSRMTIQLFLFLCTFLGKLIVYLLKILVFALIETELRNDIVFLGCIVPISLESTSCLSFAVRMSYSGFKLGFYQGVEIELVCYTLWFHWSQCTGAFVINLMT